MAKLRIGDIVEIPVPSGFGYGYFAHENTTHGDVVWLFEPILPTAIIDVTPIANWPVRTAALVPLAGLVRKKHVRIVGHLDLSYRFGDFPIFRWWWKDPDSQRIYWKLWDGKTKWPVKSLTPKEQKYPIQQICTFPSLQGTLLGTWYGGDPYWSPPEVNSQSAELVGTAPPAPEGPAADSSHNVDSVLDEDQDDDELEEAVIVLVSSPVAHEDVEQFEDELYGVMQTGEVGEFDGHETDGETWRFFLYGPDATKICELIWPIVSRYTLRAHVNVVVRHGPPGSVETEISVPNT